MRKLISLLLAVVMVMGLATVAFAADTTDAGEHTLSAKADIPTTITLAAGETATYNFDFMSEAANAVDGVEIKLTSDKAGRLWIVRDWDYYADLNVDNDYTYQGTVNISYYYGGNFAIENTGTETATYTLEVMPKPGSKNNPLPVSLGEWGNYAGTDPNGEWEKYFYYTAGAEKAEILTIKNVVLQYNALNMSNVNFNIILTREDNKEVSLFNGTGYDQSMSIALAPNETVIIAVRAAEIDESQGYVDVIFEAYAEEAPAGSERTPIEVNAAGDYIVEGDEVWYAVNSRLAGYIIAVQGDNASLVIGEDTINAVDGLATAVLNGDGAVIPVLVSNASDMIIMPAPIEINAAGDYTADVAAGAEVEYAINSRLAGAILTVEGKDAYILIGTTKYQAVDGVATAVLDSTAATIAVKVGNAGTAAAQYKLNIAFAPTAINAAGDYKVTLAPGAEAEYAVNSKLDGAVVTVKGEGAYLIVDGKKIEGKDGVVTATLSAKGATISLVVGNAGTAAAEYAINVTVPATNPQTGDFGVIAAAVAVAVSAIGGTAVVAKKKEF